MRAFLLAFFLASPVLVCPVLAPPALAETVPGLDAPAFRDPFQRALQGGDDPTALTDLHAAAEAGNVAALLALPVVSGWLRGTLPFAQRKALGRVNGTPVAEAYAAASPVAALWALGDPGNDMDALLRRAFALYDAQEPDKATVLFLTWVNQTGGYEDLPPDFFDHPVPPWAMARVLRGRLIDSGYGTLAEGEALVVDRLRANDPAAWIALAAFAGLHRAEAPPADAARLAGIFKAAGIPQDQAVQRMQAAVPVLKAIPADPALDAATLRAATAAFRQEPEFQPVLSLCAATCPATAEACAEAFVAGFGHPLGRMSAEQPLVSLISTQDFFTTPRGRLLLLRSARGSLGQDPAQSPLLAAAARSDACLAEAVLSAPP